MKSKVVPTAVLLVFVLTGCCTYLCPSRPPQCVNFKGFVHNQIVATPLMIDGFRFTAVPSGSNVRFYGVDSTNQNTTGILIDPNGLFVETPGRYSNYRISYASYHPNPIRLNTFDNNGSLLQQFEFPTAPQDRVFTIYYQDEEAEKIGFFGGGREGVVTQICVDNDRER